MQNTKKKQKKKEFSSMVEELEYQNKRLWEAIDILVDGLDKIATTHADSKSLRNLAMDAIKKITTKEM
tara:strand:- start:252 stop:455 length:204 start_codon:yes stop_codon:yes gene_type:complete